MGQILYVMQTQWKISVDFQYFPNTYLIKKEISLL